MSPTDHAPLVYVVDDDEASRDSPQWLLESAGYRAATYCTAESFLHGHKVGAAACLVLDVCLPGMSGPDLQQELNRRGELLPIIFISGYAKVPLGVGATENGACHFLEKPFQDAQLLGFIQQARARHESLRSGSQEPAW